MVKKSLNDRVVAYLRRAKNQELIIKYLRTLRFEFLTYRAFTTLYPKFHPSEVYNKYSFMVRTSEKTKYGYDIRLVVALKIEGAKRKKVLIYEDGSLTEIHLKPWNKPKKINFKKVKQNMKFDAAMTYKERRIWRTEHEKIKRNPAKHKPSKFYLENQKYVQFL
jgi:hypothetical protein